MNSANCLQKQRIPMSFLIPARNITKYFQTLKTQIEDNLNCDDEVIVIDDYSEDSTSSQLENWAKSTSNIRVIKNRGERGLISALNQGLAISSNKWIARFDADDMYSGTRLLKQSKYISENTVAIFSDYEFISETGKRMGKVPSAIYPIQTSLSLVKGNRTAHPSVIFNRDAAIDVGGYRPQDYLAEDLSLWLRMSRIGELQTVPEVLLKYRLNPGSVTLNSREQSRKMRESVLSEIGLNQADVQAAFQTLDLLISMYSTDNSDSFRKFLFLRDLRSPFLNVDMGSSSFRSKSLDKHFYAEAFKSTPDILQESCRKTLRDIYRKGLLSPGTGN